MSGEGREKKGGGLLLRKRELILGIGLFAVGMILPAVLNVGLFRIYETLADSLRRENVTELILTAVKLVLLNIVRGVPLYVGALFIGDSFRREQNRLRDTLLNAAVIVLLMILGYVLIGFWYDVHYDFGVPAVIMTVFLILFGRLDFRYVQLLKKSLSVSFFLCAVQFLDVMPFFNSSSAFFPFDRLPIGRGETSQDIKNVVILMEQEDLVNAVGVVGFALFALIGAIYLMQLRLENDLREMNSLREQNHKILLAKQEAEIQNRFYMEMRFLVHDLKSPLTAMQTMVGVMKLSPRDEAWDEECLDRMEESMEQMNRMISEIMSEERQYPATTEEILHTVMAQLSVMDFVRSIRVDNPLPEAVVNVNKILLSRALVNLVQNSAKAIPADRQPQIRLGVFRQASEPGSVICFSVKDNGTGMTDPQGTLWDLGVSGRRSSGLGLAFVAEVVRKSGGRIRVNSGKEGTEIILEIPEETEDE